MRVEVQPKNGSGRCLLRKSVDSGRFAQVPGGFETLSIMIIGTGPFRGSSRRPSCSWRAVNMDGPLVSERSRGASGGWPMDSGPP